MQYLSRAGWSVSADSQETASAGNQAPNAIDGDLNTIWHTVWSGNNPAQLPHWFRIDAGSQVSAAGLSYIPRSDGANGRIGQYTVETSNDGTTWTKISTGTWVDDGSEKVAQFTAQARYFRLNAITEAGNRGPWSSAAEINLISPVAPAYTAPAPSKGLWTTTLNFPIVPAAAAMLASGKVLLWSAYKIDDFTNGNGGYTQTAIFDPTSGLSTQRTITNTQHDMFCPGISTTFDGKIVVTGGNNAEKTTIYDPTSDSWVAGPNMQISRGYQSTATTSEGKIFNIGGSWSGPVGGKDGEIYNPASNSWTKLQSALVSPMLTADREGAYRGDNHGWLFGWKNGSVFQAGPSKAMNWYTTAGAGTVTSAGNRGNDGDAMNGIAVLYDAVNGKILSAGGAANYQADDARTNANVITIGAPGTNPTVTQTASMGLARGFANSVVLPDGTVFITGGEAHVQPFSDATAQLTPELWSPANGGTWTQLNPMSKFPLQVE